MTPDLCNDLSRQRGSRRWISLFLLPALALTFSACGSGPPPRQHLLTLSTAGSELDDTADVSSLTALGISRVTVPGYATDARVASLNGDGLLEQIDTQRWAEEPEEALTRYLAERLRRQASATVLLEPWPRDYNPQARIEVQFDRLLRESDGGASMSGQILLLSGDGRVLLQSVPFDFQVAGRTTGMSEFFKAVAVSMDELVQLAIQSLLNRRRNT